jgi:hypothetical protein
VVPVVAGSSPVRHPLSEPVPTPPPQLGGLARTQRTANNAAVRRTALLAAVLLALLAAGGASAYGLATIWLRPGHCTTVRHTHTKVCARRVKPATTRVTVTVAPSSTGRSFSGNGDSTLAPMTIPANGVVVHWTAQPDQLGDNSFFVTSSSNDANFVEFDNGSGATSGSSFIPAGTYTFEVNASATWTLSF